MKNEILSAMASFALLSAPLPSSAQALQAGVNQSPKEGQSDQPAVFKIPKDETVRIDRHKVCRMVTYVGEGVLMVSSRVPAEWVPEEEGSFLWAGAVA